MNASSSSDPTTQSDSAPQKSKSISELIGGSLTLPGEEPGLYQLSLDMLIEELGAKTILQVYLAEKIHDCLWWIRRYEEQKRITLIAEMAALTRDGPHFGVEPAQARIRDALLANKVDQKTLEAIHAARHTIESLRQVAFDKKREVIFELDEQIALQVRILAGLQASYEVAANRKINIERMTLQNELLRRDMNAIEGSKDGKPQAARRKST